MRRHILRWTIVGISIRNSHPEPLPTNHLRLQEILVLDLTEWTKRDDEGSRFSGYDSQNQPKVEIPKVLEMAEVEFLPQVAMLLEAETRVIPTPLPIVTTLTRALSIRAKS
jgi:hypothetical protein